MLSCSAPHKMMAAFWDVQYLDWRSIPTLECCWSLTQLCPTLWDLTECSTSGFPVLYYLPNFALEKAMAPHSSTLAWEIPWKEEPGRLRSMVSQRVPHDWATSLSLFTFMHWRRKWQPTPVFLPGESQGREPGGLPSMGSHRAGHDWCDLAANFALTHVHWVSDAIQPSHSLSPPSPALNLSQHQGLFPMSWLFTSGGQSIGASTSASALFNEYSGLIYFRVDWFELFPVQVIPLQHHSSKASVIQHSAQNERSSKSKKAYQALYFLSHEGSCKTW